MKVCPSRPEGDNVNRVGILSVFCVLLFLALCIIELYSPQTEFDTQPFMHTKSIHGVFDAHIYQ